MSTTPIVNHPPVGGPMPSPAGPKGPLWVKVVAIVALPCSLIPFVGLGLSAVGLGAGLFYHRISAIIMSSIAFVIALVITLAVASSSTPAPAPTTVPPSVSPVPAPAPVAPSASPAPAPAPAAPSAVPAPAPAPAAPAEPAIPYSTPPLPDAPADGSPGGSASAYYPNCAAARAAGVAPLRVGDPGYRSGLDRDGDGIACE